MYVFLKYFRVLINHGTIKQEVLLEYSVIFTLFIKKCEKCHVNLVLQNLLAFSPYHSSDKYKCVLQLALVYAL